MKTKKWYKNIIAAVISFAMVIGIFNSMQMEVKAANDYSFDATDPNAIEAAKATTYYPGDTLTFTNISGSEKMMFEVRWDYYENSVYTGSSLNYKGSTINTLSISVPSNIEYGTFYTSALPISSSTTITTVITMVVKVYYSASPLESTTTPSHECNFQWVTTVEPQPGVDGLEEYKCITCGMVKESQSIPAGMATVKNLYGFIKDAPENGTVTTDFGKLHTISDYLLKKMAERNDATVTIQFEYKNQKLQITFPAGTDYTPVLTDTDTMYGFYGVASKLGLTVTERQ